MSSAPVRGISNPTVLLELLKVLAPRFLTSFYLPTPTITLATVLLQNSVPFGLNDGNDRTVCCTASKSSYFNWKTMQRTKEMLFRHLGMVPDMRIWV